MDLRLYIALEAAFKVELEGFEEVDDYAIAIDGLVTVQISDVGTWELFTYDKKKYIGEALNSRELREFFRQLRDEDTERQHRINTFVHDAMTIN